MSGSYKLKVKGNTYMHCKSFFLQVCGLTVMWVNSYTCVNFSNIIPAILSARGFIPTFQKNCNSGSAREDRPQADSESKEEGLIFIGKRVGVGQSWDN